LLIEYTQALEVAKQSEQQLWLAVQNQRAMDGLIAELDALPMDDESAEADMERSFVKLKR